MRVTALVVALAAVAVLVTSCSVKTSFGTGADAPGEGAEGTPEAREVAASGAGPVVEAMRVGDAYDESAEQVSREATEFAPDVPEIHMDAELVGLQVGDEITASLIAVSVLDSEGSLIQNEVVASLNWEAPDPATGVHAKFSAPERGWPMGEYVIELSVNGTVVDEVEIMVQGEGSAGEAEW